MSTPHRSPRRRSLHGSALAALITVVAVCAGDAAARVFPYGHRHRSINDLGNQFVPFHAHLWDLLHGRAQGGLLLNWQSGYGTSFLPDFGTYLSSPFAVLVGLFPREDIDLAVYVVTVLKMAAAAAAMAWLLRTLRRGPWWAAGLLAASYALCGWSVIEASYNPMWLEGLIAFPLLCLTGEWALRGRRPAVAVLVVAVCWTANFYTAYMATLGAALVLLLRVVLTRQGVRERLRVLVRGAGTTLLGIAVSAPVLVPLFLSSKQAYPGWTRQFAPVSWPDVFARVLPATYSFSSPALFVGTGTLLLVAALPFHRAVPPATRLGWAGLTAAVLLSFQWTPTHLAWHVFATPNGSPYRQTFVLAGVAVIAAWTGLATAGLPGPRALAGGAAVLAAAAVAASGSTLATTWGFALFCGGLALAAAAWWCLRHRRLVLPAAGVLALVLVGQAAATTAFGHKGKLGGLDDYPSWGAAHTARAEALAGAEGWPAYRTDPSRPALSGNDPLLLGGEGGAYYSSHTPDVFTRTMVALGAGWTSRGRNVQSIDNPVTDAVFAVGARLRPDGTIGRAQVPPLITIRPPGPTPSYADGDGPPFADQELLLGARVYEDPVSPGVCRAGTEAYLWAPEYNATARLADGPAFRLNGNSPRNRAALQPLGASRGASSALVFDAAAPPRWALSCLDRARLDPAVAALRATAPTSLRVGSSTVRATVPAGTTGTAVLSSPAIAGWTCNDRPATPYLGLVSVPVAPGTTTISCSFRPPGLLPGTAVAGTALLLLGAFLAAQRRRRPRSGRPDVPGTREADASAELAATGARAAGVSGPG
ncbi:YfhO family protein [Streptomyces sp. NBC_00320]|uniref:YfhO family protein n=1 Tax=Streptomyces sp. NBC_00320 TaxID=2975711 RepID=UPI00224EDC01|nr:YfhO family protein [Streptomyces sp. NBC_00320]MCX5147358.1 YfhO family protein [Streptomyces sp. NBC_00320]